MVPKESGFNQSVAASGAHAKRDVFQAPFQR